MRVIYYLHNDESPVFLLNVYAKNQKANLTDAERSEMKKLVPILVETYRRRKRP